MNTENKHLTALRQLIDEFYGVETNSIVKLLMRINSYIDANYDDFKRDNYEKRLFQILINKISESDKIALAIRDESDDVENQTFFETVKFNIKHVGINVKQLHSQCSS